MISILYYNSYVFLEFKVVDYGILVFFTNVVIKYYDILGFTIKVFDRDYLIITILNDVMAKLLTYRNEVFYQILILVLGFWRINICNQNI